MYFPYIGITDFTMFEQVERMLFVFNKHRSVYSGRKLHVGVMMSYKTLNGLETIWSKAFPSKESIADIFGSKETYNCLHFVDYENHDHFSKTLAKAISYGGENIHAVQLDMIWPNLGDVVGGLYSANKPVELILQLGTEALLQVENNPELVVQKLEQYAGVVDRVLLDRSMGRGRAMQAEGLLPLAKAIRSWYPKLGITVAGGLGPDTVGLVKPLISEFPDLSIDAQGKLRPSGNILDPINWDMAERYVIEALKLLA